MNTQALILVVEDDPEIAEILLAYLRRDGFECRYAPNGKIALEMHLRYGPALVILDIRMPVMDGWQVLAELQRRGCTPVLVLTADDNDVNRLSALRIGADDYVIKPFNPAEVMARIQAILRRTSHRTLNEREQLFGNSYLEVSLSEHRITLRHSGLNFAKVLTTTEYLLLTHMVRQPTQVFSRQELLESCRPEGNALERTVDSHIRNIRRKLEDAGVVGMPESVRGFGYRLGE